MKSKDKDPDYEDKMKIASYPIWEKLTVRKLGLSRKIIQRSYKVMKKIDFKGDVIDFICYDSLAIFAFNVGLGFKLVDSFTKLVGYIETYLDINEHITIPMCRLLLKDMSYLDEVFIEWEITPDKKIYKESKKLLVQRINSLLKYKP